MNAVWVHDHIFYFSSDSNTYSKGKLPYSVWQRYLGFFGELHVIGRKKVVEGNSQQLTMVRSSGPRVTFSFVPALNDLTFLFKRAAARKTIMAAVKEADVVIARLPSMNGEIAVSAALKEKKPYVIEMVGCPWDALWNYGNLKGRLIAPYSYLKTKLIVKKGSYVVYVTNNFLQQRYPTEGVSAGVSNVFIPAFGDEVLEKRLNSINSRSGALVIGLIGYLGAKHKGVQVAIEALGKVKKYIPDIKLKILGGGEVRPWIELVKEKGMLNNIDFSGTLPSGMPIFSWLDSVDLYIQPSFQEGLPRALIEALSRACPALGSSAGGIPELLPRECLHTPGDKVKLANDIFLACNDKGWRKNQAERNFLRAGEYKKETLDLKRNEFWRNFVDYANTCNG